MRKGELRRVAVTFRESKISMRYSEKFQVTWLSIGKTYGAI